MNYVGNFGTTTFDAAPTSGSGILFFQSKLRLTDIKDGTSNTLALGEILVAPDITGWDLRGKVFDVEQGNVFFSTVYGLNNSVGDISNYCQALPKAPCGTHTPTGQFQMLRSMHTGGVQVCLADGSVRFISDSINQVLYQNLSTRDAGDAIGEF